ncbi:MAG: inovirus Gp2 family protein [Roseateles sp.]|uniref:inovirus Gp2 family protein n=1 Tax=Roseateles sp. TaxID=1971397 RepID=UPI0040351144
MFPHRHSLNRGQSLYWSSTFNDLPIMVEHLPMVSEMLESLYSVTACALAQYPRVFAFRFDLHLPTWMDGAPEGFVNTALSRFFESLKAKIRHDRARAAKKNGYAHDTVVRYFWVREVGDWGRVHYHCTILLNADAYNWLGNFQSAGQNMATRTFGAWASALGIPVDQAKELVHFPENPSFLLRRGDPGSIAEFFHRASYTCKAATKQSGCGHHGYGSSRG